MTMTIPFSSLLQPFLCCCSCCPACSCLFLSLLHAVSAAWGCPALLWLSPCSPALPLCSVFVLSAVMCPALLWSSLFSLPAILAQLHIEFCAVFLGFSLFSPYVVPAQPVLVLFWSSGFSCVVVPAQPSSMVFSLFSLSNDIRSKK